jgi:mannose-6-phosphate isomerase-like protein (cupin superfamily)
LAHLEHHLSQLFFNEKILPELPANWLWSAEAAMEVLKENPDGQPFVTLLENGKMYVEIYQPYKIDKQKPHDQDELYVVIEGSGIFYNNGERRPFKKHDVIFVPAGIEHRFEDFTDDFVTWVFFY